MRVARRDRSEPLNFKTYRKRIRQRAPDLDMKPAQRIQGRFPLPPTRRRGLSANMRWMTRILLVPIFLLPILWVWPQRGTTAAFYTNPQWDNEPAIVRVERQLNLD